MNFQLINIAHADIATATYDWTQVNTVISCETDYTLTKVSTGTIGTGGYGLSSSSISIQRCYDPASQFWILYGLIIMGIFLTYKVICLYKK